MYPIPSSIPIRLVTNIDMVTAGLMCAPETWPNVYTIKPIAAPCANEIMIMPSIDNPVPNAVAAMIIESGPKNTRQNVAIDSANHDLPLTIRNKPRTFQYKIFESPLIIIHSKIIN